MVLPKWSSLFAVVLLLGAHKDATLAALPFARSAAPKPATTTAGGLSVPPPASITAVDGDVAIATINNTHHHEHPERGKLLPNPASPKDLYEAYADIQQDYEAKAFHSNDWKILNDKHNVKVSLLQHPQDPTCPYVKMQGRIPVPVEECWNWLRVDDWERTMPKMDPFYEGSDILGEYVYAVPCSSSSVIADSSSATAAPHWRKPKGKGGTTENIIRMILCRKRTKRILAFEKRDLVFLSVTEDHPAADGSWVSGTVSVRTPQLPRQNGYTRAFQDSIAFYKPVKNNTETDLTIVCRIDLNDSGEGGGGGHIPMWLYVKTIGYTAAESVYKMRRALIEEHAEKQKASFSDETGEQMLLDDASAASASTGEDNEIIVKASMTRSSFRFTRLLWGNPRKNGE